MRKRILTTTPAIGVVLFCIAAFAACSPNKDTVDPDQVLVKVGNAYLTKDNLAAQMPGGLTEEDSANFAKAFIRSLINAQVVNEFASRNVDMADIDEKVAQYRKELIMYEYTRRMYDSHPTDIPEDSLKSYYDSHKDEFVLSRPLVKGVYVKIADDSKDLPKIRNLYRSNKTIDIDRLEKLLIGTAVHYDYFRDKWVDWEQIESRIPIDFSPSSDQYLSTHKNVEESQGGYTYLLDIDEVLHTGQQMPYETARQLIIDRLKYSDRLQYAERLRKELYDKALEKGDIELKCEL